MDRLPPELKSRLASSLPKRDAANLARADKDWRQLAEPRVWESIELDFCTKDGPTVSEFSGNAYSWYFEQYMALVRAPHQRSYIKKLVLRCDLIDQLPIVADVLDILGAQVETLHLSFDLHLLQGDMDYFHERLLRMPAFGSLSNLELRTSFDYWHPTAVKVLDKCPEIVSLSLCGKDVSNARPPQATPLIWPTVDNVANLDVSVDSSNFPSFLALGEKCPNMTKLHLAFKEGWYTSFPLPNLGSTPVFDKLQDLTLDIPNPRCKEAVEYTIAKVGHPRLESVCLKCQRPDDRDRFAVSANPTLRLLEWQFSMANAPNLNDTPLRPRLRPFEDNSELEILSFTGVSARQKFQSLSTGSKIFCRSYVHPRSNRTLYHYRYTSVTSPHTSVTSPRSERSPKLERSPTTPTSRATSIKPPTVVVTSNSKRNAPDDTLHPVPKRDFAILDGQVYSLTGLSEVYGILGQRMDWEVPKRGIPVPLEIWAAIDERASR